MRGLDGAALTEYLPELASTSSQGGFRWLAHAMSFFFFAAGAGAGFVLPPW